MVGRRALKWITVNVALIRNDGVANSEPAFFSSRFEWHLAAFSEMTSIRNTAADVFGDFSTRESRATPGLGATLARICTSLCW